MSDDDYAADGDGDGDAAVVVVVVAVGSSNPCKIDAVRSAFEETFNNDCGGDDSGKDEGRRRRRRRRVEVVVRSFSVDSGVSDQPFGDAETKLGATNRARAAFEACLSSSSPSSDGDADGDGGNDGHWWRGRCDFAVGLEGGIELVKEGEEGEDEGANELHHGKRVQDGGEDGVAGAGKDGGAPVAMWCMAWMAILGSDSGTCTLCRADGSSYVPPPPPPPPQGSPPLPKAGGGTGREVWGYGRTGSFLLPPRVASLVSGGMELGHADDEVFERINSKRGSGTVGVLTDGMIDRSAYYDHAIKLALVPWIRPELYIAAPPPVDGGDDGAGSSTRNI